MTDDRRSREDQMTSSTPNQAGEGAMREALEAALKEGRMLLQQAIGCAENHYGGDHEMFGLPGWLADSQARLEALSALSKPEPLPAGQGGEQVAREYRLDLDEKGDLDDLSYVGHAHLERMSSESFYLGLYDNAKGGLQIWLYAKRGKLHVNFETIDTPALSPPLSGGWRSMDSAPRDGTHILIAFGQDHVSVGAYHRNDDDPHPWKFMDSQGEGLPIFNGARDDQYGPSKWQPLPAPPSPLGLGKTDLLASQDRHQPSAATSLRSDPKQVKP